jgi:hypothetical protein
MASVVGVHGVGQQSAGPNTLHTNWFPAWLMALRRRGVRSDRMAWRAPSMDASFVRQVSFEELVILRTDPRMSRLAWRPSWDVSVAGWSTTPRWG